MRLDPEDFSLTADRTGHPCSQGWRAAALYGLGMGTVEMGARVPRGLSTPRLPAFCRGRAAKPHPCENSPSSALPSKGPAPCTALQPTAEPGVREAL